MHQKNLGIEYLRVFASFSVIVIHVAALAIRQTTGYSHEFALFLDTFSRVAVPLFFMISGYLMLDCHKQPTLSQVWKKTRKRVIAPFVFWSLAYVAFSILFLAWTFQSFNEVQISRQLFTGMTMYHFWFLPVLGCYYLATPWLNSRLKKLNDVQLLGVIIISLTLGFAMQFASVLTGFGIFALLKLIGFLGYYAFGYLVKRRQSQVRKRISVSVYVSLSLCTLASFWLANGFLSVERTIGLITDNFFPAIIIASMSLFVGFVHHTYQNNRWQRFVLWLSPMTFGIYFIHVAILLLVATLGELSFGAMVLNPLLLIVGVSLISLLSIYSLRKIAFFRQFI